MFLCLYSGGERRRNEHIDLRIVERMGKRASITYIPSDSTHPGATSFFEDFKRYYGYYGIRSFKYFCHDRPFRPVDMHSALEADAVYLSGGNTFYFSHSLRRSKLDSKLRSFATKGGALLGQSAGSILMTPTITTAAVGPIKDENEVGLKDLTGLGLINVLFVPHYEERRKVTTELRRFSSASDGRLLVAAQDGGGIIKSEEALTFAGPVTLFSGGEVLGTMNKR
jgi:dipeptidase E